MKRANPQLAIIIFLAILLTGCDADDMPTRAGSGLAVLAQGAQGYAQARPGQRLVFPQDYGAHPYYRIEWWYLTANLNDPAGNPYGAQWTLFRIAVQPPGTDKSAGTGQNHQLFMAHFAITTPRDHVSFQRYSREYQHAGDTRAGVTAEPFAAWLDDWVMGSTGTSILPMEVRARQGAYGLRLQLNSQIPMILQGDAGFSQKHPNGGGSFYYSQPFLEAGGELTMDGQKIPVSGQAWLDREWSSQFLQGDQVGWDWFSLHLESGEKLMLFQVRQHDAKNPDENFVSGTLIAADGATMPLDPDQIRLTVVEKSDITNRKLPLRWRMELPQIGRDFEIKALHPGQWMDVDFPYWEGVIIMTGADSKNRGRGYMELTGYPEEG